MQIIISPEEKRFGFALTSALLLHLGGLVAAHRAAGAGTAERARRAADGDRGQARQTAATSCQVIGKQNQQP